MLKGGGEDLVGKDEQTNIEAVQEQAHKSGLSYNEAKAWLAKTTGGRGTHVYSNTDVEAVKTQNKQSELKKN